jgi:hypothetical protein
VPAVYVAVLEQVKLNVAKFIVPAVWVYVVQLNAAERVAVPAPLLIVNAAIALPFGVIVPVPTIVADTLVKVPPTAKVNAFKLTVVAAGVDVVPVKLSKLNQLPVVIDGTAAPVVIARFGAFVVEPLVVPKT